MAKNTPFKKAAKKIKCLAIHLARGGQNLCVDNCERLLKGTKADSKNWKSIPFLGQENNFKMMSVPLS